MGAVAVPADPHWGFLVEDQKQRVLTHQISTFVIRSPWGNGDQKALISRLDGRGMHVQG